MHKNGSEAARECIPHCIIMGVFNNTKSDSADAKVAFQTIYDCRFPLPSQVQHLATSHSHQRGLLSEEIGETEGEPGQVVDREVIGRQAFLLDEVLRHAEDGRIARAPLQHSYSYDGRRLYRGGHALWELLDNEPMSRFGWRIDAEPADLREYEKHLLVQRMATKVEKAHLGVGTMNSGLRNEREGGEFLGGCLAEEQMYHMYINEEA